MPRIPLPIPEAMSEEQRKVYEDVVAGPRGALRGPLLAALHRPELADKWQKLGELLRYRTCLAPRHSELAILVTAQVCRCAFEWHAHEGIARNAGLTDETLESIRRGKVPRFDDVADANIYYYALELHQLRIVTDQTYAKVLNDYGVVGVVELTALIGYYTMVAMTLNAHQIPLPDGAVSPFA